MAAQSFTVELTEDQARIVPEIAEAHGIKPDAVLIEAIGHGLAMIVAGVNEDELVEPWDRPEPNPPKRKQRGKMPSLTGGKGDSDMGGDIPF
ncbi:hypothetical protein [Lichenicoccus roseus]|uniref:Uncharacterized protein n=1 Tax=Lichenicoccus roseus TaxID=2683649 RepID=A0A5R9J4K8_9PROT|nr:hypothetical protein [Lichenicoccus roseus]TLU70551.1 hypothetical protein FE263_21510 [Lichenicoccus roseus]